MKTLRVVFGLLLACTCVPLFAQEDPDQTNPLYEPVAVVQRLSYDNFKNIRLITVAIMNYGGGEADFNRLVEGYADASALYFSRDYKKAAVAFEKNEKDIMEVAMKLAEKYKQDSESLNKETITYNVKMKIAKSVKGENPSLADLAGEKLISQGAEGVAKGNDYYVRSRPVQAIATYRKAKEQYIQYYETIGVKEVNGQKIADRFEKDKKDSKNQIFVAKEKKN